MTETRLVADGLGFPESTRWHEGRVCVCNWGAGEVLAVTTGGEREVIARIAPQTIPFSIDWLPDGRLLVVDGPQQTLLRQDWDGALEPIADLSGLGTGPFNELVVTGAGGETVERHHHLENDFSIAHQGRDLPARANSSRICGIRGKQTAVRRRPR
jgi:sugar lactone lactonase YvrE